MAEFGVTRNGSETCVTLPAKLTAVETPALQASLKEELAAGAREILFDCADTASVDSTGIGLLIAASNSLTPLQGSMRLVNVSPDIMKLLRSMRLVDRLHASQAL